MALRRCLVLLWWAGGGSFTLRTRRLNRQPSCAKKRAESADHDDLDDRYALNDIKTNELRLPTMADLMRCLTQRHLRPASMASTR